MYGGLLLHSDNIGSDHGLLEHDPELHGEDYHRIYAGCEEVLQPQGAKAEDEGKQIDVRLFRSEHGQELFTYDLKNGPQIFDYQSLMLEYRYGILKKFTPAPLESCTRQHWSHMPQMLQNFDNLKMSKWLCPALNSTFTVQGFPLSEKYQIMTFNVMVCVNKTSNGNKCAPQQTIDQTFAKFSNFYLRYSIVNPVINPSQPQHTNYYIEDRNMMIFSRITGSQMNLELTDYTIISDESILPYESNKYQSGYIIQDRSPINSYSVNNAKTLALITLTKSASSLVYNRQVLKISAVVSYIGGLISAFTVFLFMLKKYTQTSLEINLSLDLFYKSEESEQNQQNNTKEGKLQFGFRSYLYFMFYKFLKMFKKGQGFLSAIKFQKYQQEMQNQLDIKILLERLIKLQSCMKYLFNDDEIFGIQNIKAITFEQAKELRTFLFKKEEDQQGAEQANNDWKQEQPEGNLETLAYKENIFSSPLQNCIKFQELQVQTSKQKFKDQQFKDIPVIFIDSAQQNHSGLSLNIKRPLDEQVDESSSKMSRKRQRILKEKGKGKLIREKLSLDMNPTLKKQAQDQASEQIQQVCFQDKEK